MPSTDIIEDMYSPRTAAINFISELIRKRGKENLQKFLGFIVEIFRRYIHFYIYFYFLNEGFLKSPVYKCSGLCAVANVSCTLRLKISA